MRLFWLPAEYQVHDSIRLSSEDSRRLCGVLRMREGEFFKARDKQANLYNVIITKADKKETCIEIRSKEPFTNTAPVLELWQAIPKGSRFDDALRMAVEAGCSRIVPVITEHSDVKRDRESLKNERYERLAIEAVSQCGSLYYQEVAKPMPLKEALASLRPEDLAFFCHQEDFAGQKLSGLLTKAQEKIIIVIGPEGGFSDTEVALMQQNGLYSIYLGDTILRSETAGIFMIAAIKMMLKER